MSLPQLAGVPVPQRNGEWVEALSVHFASKDPNTLAAAFDLAARFHSDSDRDRNALLDAVCSSFPKLKSEILRCRGIECIQSLLIAGADSESSQHSQVARDAVDLLLRIAEPRHTENGEVLSLMSALRSVVALMCRRPSYVPLCLPRLAAFSPSAFSEPQNLRVRRMQRSLRLPIRELLASNSLDNVHRVNFQKFADAFMKNSSSKPARRRPSGATSSSAAGAVDSGVPQVRKVLQRPKLMDRQARDPMFNELLERLNALPAAVEFALISKCMNNVPDVIESCELQSRCPPAILRMLTLLVEHSRLESDPRLRDPRLRASLQAEQSDALQEAKADAALVEEHFLGAIQKVQNQSVQQQVQTVIPKVPVLKLSPETIEKLKFAAFERAMKAAGASETLFARLLSTFGSTEMDNRVCDFVLEAASDRLELGVQVTYALACVSEQRRVQFLDRLVEGLLRTIDAASTDADTHSKCLSRLLTQCAGNLDHTLQQLHAILLEQHEQIDQAKVIARRTAILRVLREIVVHRAGERKRVLERLLQYAAQQDRALRTPAIGLITNKLFTLPRYHSEIRSHAENLLRTLQEIPEPPPAPTAPEKSDDKVSGENPEDKTEDKMKVDEVDEVMAVRNAAEADALKRLELYVALCTREPQMLPLLFQVFADSKPFVRVQIHKQMLSLVRTLGTGSSSVLEALRSFPTGSESLALHLLYIITDGEEVPSDTVVSCALDAYQNRTTTDARFLIPVICGMKRPDLVAALPDLVALAEKHRVRALQQLARPDSPLSPSELLVRLHVIAPTPDHPLLRKVMEATAFCLLNRAVFVEKVLGVCLQQLVERSPVPVLTVRTLIQALAAHPGLIDFGMFILGRLINKRVWEQPQLWQGFIVCTGKFRPHSFPVMLQLPRQRLAELLERQKDPKLKEQLGKFVKNSRMHVRRSVYTLLALDSYRH